MVRTPTREKKGDKRLIDIRPPDLRPGKPDGQHFFGFIFFFSKDLLKNFPGRLRGMMKKLLVRTPTRGKKGDKRLIDIRLPDLRPEKPDG